MATLTLGAFGSGLRGKTSSTVFVQTAGGVVVRDRIIPANPRTPGQVAQRNRIARATVAWSQLDPAQISAWVAYAQRLAVRDPGSGLMRAPRPQNLFVALYSKLLQLDPNAPPPASPPENPFFGDNISVSIDDLRLTIDDCPEAADGQRRKLLPPSLPVGDFPAAGQASSVTNQNEEGVIRFTASAPNAPGVTTELLLQPLESGVRRTYLSKYRHATFFAFAAGSLSVEVPVPMPGWYACGYRFVNTATGQDTGVVECGKVWVD